MERPSTLHEPRTSPRHDAHSRVFPGLGRNIGESIWRGGSYERSIWLHHQHDQWEGMYQRSEGILSYNRRVAAVLTRREDIPGAERLPHRAYTDGALMFLRGERNGDFLLQHHCRNAMALSCSCEESVTVTSSSSTTVVTVTSSSSTTVVTRWRSHVLARRA